MNTELKYHRDAVNLLPEVPRFSVSSAELLRKREEQLGIKFPDSVREWYSLDGAVNLLELYSNNDSPVEIDKLGDLFEDWYGGGPKDFLSERILLFMHENQGVCNWAISLDGSSDPPVIVEVDTAPNAKWLPCADKFSTFIWCQIWDHSQHSVGVSAQEIELTKVDLDFLKSNFRQHRTTNSWPGNANYRFESTDARILIWEGEDQADWFLSASTASDLKRLLAKVWHCGRLADSLYGDGESQKVLKQMDSGTRK